MIDIILITAIFAFAIAFILGNTLGFFGQVFAVPLNPIVQKIRDALPGANCGACGFPGCENYAEAVAAGNAAVTACTVGGKSVIEKVSAITGVKGGEDAFAWWADFVFGVFVVHALFEGEVFGGGHGLG